MSSLPKASKRGNIIKRFRKLGWTGPHKGVGDHPEYMAHADGRVVKMPNKHSKGDIGEALLKLILKEAGLTADEWLGTELKKGEDRGQEADPHDGDDDDGDEDDSGVEPSRPTNQRER